MQNIIYILLASWFCSRKKLKQTPDAAGIQEFSCFRTWKYFSHMQCVFFLIKKINKTKNVRSFPFPYWAAFCVFVYFTKQKQTNSFVLLNRNFWTFLSINNRPWENILIPKRFSTNLLYLSKCRVSNWKTFQSNFF